MNNEIAVFWFRRDLRLSDNTGLIHALSSGLPVLPIFIFDTHILDKLDNPKDARVDFIHQTICNLDLELKKYGREDIMVIAGGVIPQQDYDFLYKAGVSGVFGPGTVISISAIDILEKLIEKNK
jgi:deoxyribodipyrimidine photolyase